MMLRIVRTSTIMILCWKLCEAIQTVPPVLGYGGETTNVICYSTGIIPGISYSWLKDKVDIFQHTNEGTIKDGKYNGTTQTGQISLQVLNTNLSDAGNYTCSFNFDDVDGTLSVAYKPERIAHQVSRIKGLQLTLTALKVYPRDSTISIVTCTSHNSSIWPLSSTETFSASQSIISNKEVPLLYDILWIGTTTRTSLTGEYVCTINFTSIKPYVTSVNVTFTAAATIEEFETDKLEGWLIGLIVASVCVTVVFAVAVGIICWVICKRRTERKPNLYNNDSPDSAPSVNMGTRACSATPDAINAKAVDSTVANEEQVVMPLNSPKPTDDSNSEEQKGEIRY